MEAKVIIIGNQKGGCGKSSISSFIMNYLHTLVGKKVLGLDADEQQTLVNLRKSDELSCDENETLYDLESVNLFDVPEVLENRKMFYDYIFIDLPGSLMAPGVNEVYYQADVLIIPHALSRQDIDATVSFIKDYYKYIYKGRKSIGKETKICGLVAKIDPKMLEYKEFVMLQELSLESSVNENVIKELQFDQLGKLVQDGKLMIDYLKNSITENKTIWERNVSTFKVYQSKKDGVMEFAPLYKELLTKIL